jgi:anti-anti-sigma factor
VVVALRGELDVCTAADGLSALTAPAGTRVVVDLAELAFMDCYSLGVIMAVRARARRAGGDLVLAGPQQAVHRLLALCDMVSRGLVFTSVGEAVSGAGSAPAALVMSGAAAGAAASLARSGIVSSALFRGGAAMRHSRMLTGLLNTAASRKQHAGEGTLACPDNERSRKSWDRTFTRLPAWRDDPAAGTSACRCPGA